MVGGGALGWGQGEISTGSRPGAAGAANDSRPATLVAQAVVAMEEATRPAVLKQKREDVSWTAETERAEKQLRVVVEAVPQAGGYHVGEAVQVRVWVVNRTAEPVTLYQASKAYEASVWLERRIEALQADLSIAPHERWRPDPKAAAEAFIDVEAGARLGPMTIEVTPLAPGKMTVWVTYDNYQTDGYMERAGRSWRTMVYPRIFLGYVSGDVKLEVREEPSEAMRARYDEARRKVLDGSAPMEARLGVLKTIADEKHVQAVRFLMGIWREAKEARVKLAALDQVMELVRYGTGYEALPEIVALLRNPLAPSDLRGRAMDGLMQWERPEWGGYPAIDAHINDGRKLIMEVARDLVKGDDPVLVEKALAVLAKEKADTAPATQAWGERK